VKKAATTLRQAMQAQTKSDVMRPASFCMLPAEALVGHICEATEDIVTMAKVLQQLTCVSKHFWAICDGWATNEADSKVAAYNGARRAERRAKEQSTRDEEWEREARRRKELAGEWVACGLVGEVVGREAALRTYLASMSQSVLVDSGLADRAGLTAAGFPVVANEAAPPLSNQGRGQRVRRAPQRFAKGEGVVCGCAPTSNSTDDGEYVLCVREVVRALVYRNLRHTTNQAEWLHAVDAAVSMMSN
jgi:hypothetical protein